MTATYFFEEIGIEIDILFLDSSQGKRKHNFDWNYVFVKYTFYYFYNILFWIHLHANT